MSGEQKQEEGYSKKCITILLNLYSRIHKFCSFYLNKKVFNQKQQQQSILLSDAHGLDTRIFSRQAQAQGMSIFSTLNLAHGTQGLLEGTVVSKQRQGNELHDM